MPLPLIVLLAGAALSAGAQIYSATQQANALEEQANYEQELAEIRAKSLRREAEQERLNRLAEERSERRFTRRRRAAAEAAYAKSGVLLSGTPELMLVEQAKVDELDIQQGNRDSLQKRKLIEVGAKNSLLAGMNRSSAYKAQAKSTLIGGYVNAGVGAATSVMGSGITGGDLGLSKLGFSSLWGGKASGWGQVSSSAASTTMAKGGNFFTVG